MGLDSTIIVKPSAMKIFFEIEEMLDFLELNPLKQVPESLKCSFEDLCNSRMNKHQFQNIATSWQNR
jgi:hypothetical protein